jgi:hypothetical protein
VLILEMILPIAPTKIEKFVIKKSLKEEKDFPKKNKVTFLTYFL